jgi:hypothetical protein
MPPSAEIAWNRRRVRIDLSTAVLRNAEGAVVLAADDEGLWHVVDRSPVSARLARGDGAVCRFEMLEDGLLAEIGGGSWTGRSAAVVKLDAEVRDGDVAAEDRT